MTNDKNQTFPYSLDKLGFTDDTVMRIRQAVEGADGVVISGKTASGKTATSLALLGEMSPKVDKILALEGPPYETKFFRMIPNVRAVPVPLALAMTDYISWTEPDEIESDYDYDAIYFNELRELEVFTRFAYARRRKPGYPIATVHAETAAHTLTQLGGISNKAFGLIESSVSVVICQILVKFLCSCKEEYVIGAEESPAYAGSKFFRAKGCAKCYYKGYDRDRRPIAEVMNVTPDMINAMINDFGDVESQIEDKAKDRGMVSLSAQAWALLCDGLIDLEQFYRVKRGW